MEEKKNTQCNVALVIMLMLMVLGLGAYITYDKVLSNKDNTDNKTEKNTVVVSQDEIDTIMDIIDKLPNKDSLDIESLKKMDNQDKLKLAMNFRETKAEDSNSFKGKDLKDALIKMFGSDLDIKLESYKCGMDHENDELYIYNEKTDTFTYNDKHLGHGVAGDSTIDTAYNYFVSYETESNNIIFKVKKIFEGSAGDIYNSCQFYKIGINTDDKDARKNTNYCKKVDEYNYECDCDKIYEDEKANLKTYTYIFEKENNNFVFKSYSIEK